MAVQVWDTLKDSITAYTGLSPATFFTAIALGLAIYYMALDYFGSQDDAGDVTHGSRDFGKQASQPLPPPVQLGEISDEELKQYDGSDPKKPLLMAIKGQIYDVSQSRMFYGPGGPYALFAGKDASRALAKMSFEERDLNGDLTGLGVFELEALQDWEYKFMGKYVKVGTVKATPVPVTDGAAADTQTSEAASSDGATKHTEAANGDVEKTAENGPSESAAKETTEETKTAGDDEEKKE